MNNKKFLIVDDEELLRDMLVEVLTAEGYKVDSAANGIEASELIISNDYELVATDFFMPNMNGLEFIKTCQNSFPDIKFILFSGGGKDLEINVDENCIAYKGQEIIVDLYIKKPFSINDILVSIENLLSQK